MHSPSTTTSFAVRLGTIGGIALLALAALAVLGGELTSSRPQVVAAVAADALVKLVLGASLVILARFAGRRLPNALWATSLVSALSLPYLALHLLVRVPGVSLRLTLPGPNVFDTTVLRENLDRLRPAWHGEADTALTIFCLAALTVQLGILIASVVRREQPAAAVSSADADLPARSLRR
jgi:hypothetical protein